MPEPHLRIGDAERTAMAETLGRHMAAGRLTIAEFDERLGQAYAARTHGDLSVLTTDLPPLAPAHPVATSTAAPPAPSSSAGAHAGQHGRPGHGHPCGGWAPGELADAWRSWARTAGIVLAIYFVISFVSFGFGYFWPVWVIVPWGAVLLARTTAQRLAGLDDRRRRLGA